MTEGNKKMQVTVIIGELYTALKGRKGHRKRMEKEAITMTSLLALTTSKIATNQTIRDRGSQTLQFDKRIFWEQIANENK